MSKTRFERLRRNIVVLKFTMARGYIWCQTPTMALIAAGVMKPYFPGIQFWQLALIGAVIFMFVGFLDRKFKFLNEESSYATERNTLLMKKFEDLKENNK